MQLAAQLAEDYDDAAEVLRYAGILAKFIAGKEDDERNELTRNAIRLVEQ